MNRNLEIRLSIMEWSIAKMNTSIHPSMKPEKSPIIIHQTHKLQDFSFDIPSLPTLDSEEEVTWLQDQVGSQSF